MDEKKPSNTHQIIFHDVILTYSQLKELLNLISTNSNAKNVWLERLEVKDRDKHTVENNADKYSQLEIKEIIFGFNGQDLKAIKILLESFFSCLW